MRPRTTILALGATAAALSFGGAAWAQAVAPGLGMGADASPQFGELGPRTMSVQARARATYNSNVAGGDDAVAAARGVRKDDITYSPGVDANIVQPLGLVAVFLRGSAGYDFQQYSEKLSRERINLSGGVQTGVGPCGVGINTQWNRSQSDLGLLAIETVKNTQQTVSVGGSLACQFGVGFGQSIGVSKSRATNSADVGVIDAEQTSYSAGLTYSSEALGTAAVFASYATSGYDNSSASVPTLPGFETRSFGVSLSRPIGARMTGSASLAYMKAKPKGIGGFETSSLGGSGSLNYQVNPRLSASVSYGRTVVPSIIEGYEYALSESVSLSAAYALSPRLRTSLGASWSGQSYKGQPATPLLVIEDSNARTIFAGISTTVGRRATLSLDVRRTVREARPATFNYTSNQVGVTLALPLL